MTKSTLRSVYAPGALTLVLAAALLVPAASGLDEPPPAAEDPVVMVPADLGPATEDAILLPDTAGRLRATTLNPHLQNALQAYLIDQHAPIAAAVVLDIGTGSILAMAQGKAPAQWGAKTHSALHPHFPAASLFKTVVTAAALEVGAIDDRMLTGLPGGCQQVRENGAWLADKEPTRQSSMSLRKAYGLSCNSYFAKLAVNDLGLSLITRFARRLGWDSGLRSDFQVEKSPFLPPAPANSSTHTVGSFAAGFGHVGTSALHAAWLMAVIGNGGRDVPVRMLRDSPLVPEGQRAMLMEQSTAASLLDLMSTTVRGGTASFAFRRGKYRKLRDYVGGKTGTLTGKTPAGLTTLFAGVAPLQKPEIAVAAIVVLNDRWYIKAPNLAAEAIWSYYDLKMKQQLLNTAGLEKGVLDTTTDASDSVRPSE